MALASRLNTMYPNSVAMDGNMPVSIDDSETRQITYEVHVTWEDGEGTWSSISTEFTLFGFELGDEGCAEVRAVSGNTGGVSEWSTTVCATAGEEVIAGCTDEDANNYNPDANSDDGTCEYCNPGDVNGDNTVNVTDIVSIVNFILGGGTDVTDDLSCGDMNADGIINVTDIVTVVNYILGGGTLGSTTGSPAEEAIIVMADNGLSVESNKGLIKGVQLVLSHDPGFEIILVEEGANEWVRQNELNANTTIVLLVQDDVGFIGTTKGDYKIKSHVVVNELAKAIDSVTQDTRGSQPVAYEVKAAYPNPFNPSTTLEVVLPEAGYLSIKIYNLVGQEVATLANGYVPNGGTHQFVWNAMNMSSGVYLAKVEGLGAVQTQKLMLLK